MESLPTPIVTGSWLPLSASISLYCTFVVHSLICLTNLLPSKDPRPCAALSTIHTLRGLYLTDILTCLRLVRYRPASSNDRIAAATNDAIVVFGSVKSLPISQSHLRTNALVKTGSTSLRALLWHTILMPNLATPKKARRRGIQVVASGGSCPSCLVDRAGRPWTWTRPATRIAPATRTRTQKSPATGHHPIPQLVLRVYDVIAMKTIQTRIQIAHRGSRLSPPVDAASESGLRRKRTRQSL